MCLKLSQKYKVANPLDAAPKVADTHSTPAKSEEIGFGSFAPTSLSSSDDKSSLATKKKPPLGSSQSNVASHTPKAGFGDLSDGISPGPLQSPVLGGFLNSTSSSAHSPFGSHTSMNLPAHSPFGSSAISAPGAARSPFGSSSATPASHSMQPSFGGPGSSVPGPIIQAPFGSSTLTPPAGFGSMSSHNMLGQTVESSLTSPFGRSPTPAITPLATPTGAPATFLGKTAREMLTAFYQEKNPSKLPEIDKNLAKYLGREEELFRNLAKKYSVPLAAFGLPESTPASGFGSTGIGMSASPGFGQPSTLGGGSTFGSTPPSFGGALNTGFGAASSGPGFGSASGAGTFGSQGFGALAHTPAPVGFGSFGSPPATSPFGAPRR